MPQAFPELVRRILPTASNSTIASIEAHFPYPADLPAKLAWDWTTAMVFECNVYNVAKAFEDKTRRYIMSIPPAIHGQDVPCKSLARRVCRVVLLTPPRHVLHRRCLYTSCKFHHSFAVSILHSTIRFWPMEKGSCRPAYSGYVRARLASLWRGLDDLQHYFRRVR